jgi:hypothetical protein
MKELSDSIKPKLTAELLDASKHIYAVMSYFTNQLPDFQAGQALVNDLAKVKDELVIARVKIQRM